MDQGHLWLNGCEVSNSTISSMGNESGGLVGLLRFGTFSGCSVSELSLSADYEGAFIGSLGSSATPTFTDCTNSTTYPDIR